MLRTTEEVSREIELSLKKYPSDRKRYWVAHLADGRQIHEHQCRWVDVPLYEIVMLELSMMANKYRIERRNCPGFVEFIQFKTAERHLKGVKGQSDSTTSRCIGWTNGVDEFIVRVDEKTGRRIGGIESCLLREGHLHPLSKLKKEPNTIIIPNPVVTVSGQ